MLEVVWSPARSMGREVRYLEGEADEKQVREFLSVEGEAKLSCSEGGQGRVRAILGIDFDEFEADNIN